MTTCRNRRERGAAAVEMAILLPLLLLIIAGIIDLGRLMFTQVQTANAAREGARMLALGYTNAQAQTRVTQASPGLPGLQIDFTTPGATVRCPTTPGPTDAAVVKVTMPTSGAYQFKWVMIGNISRFFGVTMPAPVPNSTASMRCLA